MKRKTFGPLCFWDTVLQGRLRWLNPCFSRLALLHASAVLKTALQSQITTPTQKRRGIRSTLLSCTAIGRDMKSISSIRPDTLILFETPSPLSLRQKQPSLPSPLQTVFKSTPENYGIWPVKKDLER